MKRLSPRLVVAAFLVLLFVWLLPEVPQPQDYHLFADQRKWLGIPRAADVLSNLAFVAAGLFAVARVGSRNRARFSAPAEASLWCLAVGLLLTAAGSAWYHHDPNDATLVWDRLPMTLVFGGVAGLAIAQRIANDVAWIGLVLTVTLGLSSVVYWPITGDIAPYLLVQLGGFAAVIALVAKTPKGDDPFPWWWLISLYGYAKLFELADWCVWRATKGLVAGHALKHLAAALAVAALFAPLRKGLRNSPAPLP